MVDLKYYLGPMRPPFLVLTPVCVFLGWGTANWSQGVIHASYLAWALVCAIAAHVGVNALNEYMDFKSGLDLKTERTPFSGGSGTLPKRPDLAPYALLIGTGAVLVTTVTGLWLAYERGPGLLALGILGVSLIVLYTPWITRHPLLSLVAPGLGFGPVMVIGTHLALSGEFAWSAVAASLVPFFLVNNLLLLNQFPDVEADRGTGRRNLPIVIGRKSGSIVYGVFMVCAYVSLAAGVSMEVLPAMTLWGLLTILPAIPTVISVYRNAENPMGLLPWMRQNVVITLLTPVLMTAGLFYD